MTKEKLPAQLKWEKDLSKTLSEEDWDAVFRSCFKVSKCMNHSEMFYKLIQRAYYTPEKLHKIWPSTSKFCWRKCGCIGDLYHVFWSCLALKDIWGEVFQLISGVIGYPLLAEPEVALLHLFSERIQRGDRYLVGHILIATKSSIAQLWKTDRVPCLQEIINKVHKHFLFETADCTCSSGMSALGIKWA